MMSRRLLTMLAALAGLAGCAYEGPAGEGHAVRAIMASQIIVPQPHPQQQPQNGADAVAAAAAYANYKQSYQQPTPQSDSGLVHK